jgi:hypothetical protein
MDKGDSKEEFRLPFLQDIIGKFMGLGGFEIGDWVLVPAYSTVSGRLSLRRYSDRNGEGSTDFDKTVLCQVAGFSYSEVLLHIPPGAGDTSHWTNSETNRNNYGCIPDEKYWWCVALYLIKTDKVGKFKKRRVKKPVNILCRGCGKSFLWIVGTSKRSFACPSCRIL